MRISLALRSLRMLGDVAQCGATIRLIAKFTLLAATLGYFALFFFTPVPAFRSLAAGGQAVDRCQFLLPLVLDPQAWVGSWFGGDVARFGLFDRLPIVAVAGAILFAAYVAGSALLTGTGCHRGLSRLERFVFAIGVGLNGVSLYTLAIGLAGGLHQRWLFVLPVLALLLYGMLRDLPNMRRMLRHLASSWRGRANRRFVILSHGTPTIQPLPSDATANWLTRRGAWLLLPFVSIIFLGAMLPPWHFDARVYHLQVPKEWFEQGRIGFMPHNIYGNMPSGAELHALLAMELMPGREGWWGGALAGKVVLAAFAPLTALALLAAGQRFFSTTAGIVAAIVYLSTPWVAFVSMTGLNEGASAFYWLLAGYATLLWSRNRTHTRPLWLAGFMAASAVACKYPAVVFLLLPLLAGIFWSRSRTSGGSSRFVLHWRAVATFTLAAACACGLWLGKNWVLTKNPTYPLLHNVFGGETRTPEKDEQWTRAHAPPRDALGRIHSLDQLSESFATFAWRSSGLSPLMLPLAVAALFFCRQRRTVFITAGFIVYVLAVWWLLTHRFDRFWVPLLPLLALLAGAGGVAIVTKANRRVLAAALVLGLVVNFAVLSSRVLGDNRFFVALGELRADEPRPDDGGFSRINPFHRVLNSVVPRDGKVLLVGDFRPYDLEVPCLYNTCFDDCLFEQLLCDRSPNARRAALQRAGLTHVFISWSDIACLRRPGDYGFTPFVTRELVDELVALQVLRKIPLDAPIEIGEVFEVVAQP